MTATPEEKRAYQRGYWASTNNRWPEYNPPNPPQLQVRVLFDAAKALRDAALDVLAVIDAEDSPQFLKLKAEAAAVDAAFVEITTWLRKVQP